VGKSKCRCLIEYCKCGDDGPITRRNATSGVLLKYIKQDIETMSVEQLRETYRRVRKIVAGLD